MMFKVSPGLSISALDAALDDSEAARRSSCSALGPTWNGCRGGSMLPSANFSSPFGAPGRCAAALRARRSQDGAVPARQDSAPQGLLHCRLALGMRCCSGTTGSSVSLRKGQLLVNARVQATTTGFYDSAWRGRRRLLSEVARGDGVAASCQVAVLRGAARRECASRAAAVAQCALTRIDQLMVYNTCRAVISDCSEKKSQVGAVLRGGRQLEADAGGSAVAGAESTRVCSLHD